MGVSALNMELLVESMSDLVFVMTLDTSNVFRYEKMNTSAMKASGLNLYAYGATFYDVLDRQQAEFLDEQYHKALAVDEPVSFVFNYKGQIGETKLNIINTDSERYVLGVVRDITERADREQRLRREAHFDALTGLLNRYGLQERLEGCLVHAKKSGTLLVLSIIDVDSLKEMNDTWGHLVGDAVLQAAARRIQGVIRKEDIVARIGGDEFVLAALINTREEGVVLAERIRSALASPWLQNETSIPMSASVGIAIFPLHGTTLADVIHRADQALYRAKQQPGTCYVFAEV